MLKFLKISKLILKKINKIKNFALSKLKNFLNKNFCWIKLSIFWNFIFIIDCCLNSTKLICFNNRCCRAKTSRNSIFNFFYLFLKRRYRIVFKKIKLFNTINWIHFVHLLKNSLTRQNFDNRIQLQQKRIVFISKSIIWKKNKTTNK